jgi:MFS family permease
MAQVQPSSAPPEPSPSAAGADPTFPWFVVSVGSWFGAFGLQSVLYSALLLKVLQETPQRIGFAMAALMLPPVFLLLLGGAVADRSDRRGLLTRLHLLATALVAGLAFAVYAGSLSYELLIAFALAIGCLTAFALPARDSLLSEVAGPNLMNSVVEMNMVQWGSQAVGSVIGTSTRWIGFAPALAVQAAILLVGAGALRRLRPAPPAHGHDAPPLSIREVLAGAREVTASPLLRSPWLLVMAVGVLFIGPFQVAIPVMVRDYYGNPDLLGLFFMTFPLGTILGSVVIRLRGGIRRKGRAQLYALSAGSLALAGVALGLPFWGALLLLCGWGFFGSVFMASGRTLFQENSPATHRGRILSVYTLGFMGSAPLGAALSGYLVATFGALGTCAICAAAMLGVVAATAAFSNAARLE